MYKNLKIFSSFPDVRHSAKYNYSDKQFLLEGGKIMTDVNQIHAIYNEQFPDWVLNEGFLSGSLLFFLGKLSLQEVKEAMTIACKKMDDPAQAVKYFCGICWTKIKSTPIRRVK